MNQSVLEYMTDRIELATSLPAQDFQIDFRTCYRMIEKLTGLQRGKNDAGDYLYALDALDRIYGELTAGNGAK